MRLSGSECGIKSFLIRFPVKSVDYSEKPAENQEEERQSSDSAIGCEEALDCCFFVDEKRWADSHGTFWRFWADLERIWGPSEVGVRREEKVEAFGRGPG
jgi:hypothetical protein